MRQKLSITTPEWTGGPRQSKIPIPEKKIEKEMKKVQKPHKPIKENNGISHALGTFHLPPGFNIMF